MKKPCKATFKNQNCTRKSHANELCGLHDTQTRRHGHITSLHPNPQRAIAHLPAIQRFASRLAPGGVNEQCWEWQGHQDKDGYAWFHDSGKKQRGHRWAWVNLGEQPLNNGTEIDHICSNPCCVRPSHLQALTPTKHHTVSQQRKALLAAHGKDEWEWNAGNPKPLSIRELNFGIVNGLPVNLWGSEVDQVKIED
ncbi:HNH endonuclease [Arthrobacter sp. MYb227]|uniref:HNH endonuclease n=1 Tax=Arthrobacter sp. MYb227 TaxID=1848601 RepID=UPI0015E38427|nr:HNH endonuclease [Arthrobacter sp. MYb227]